MSTDGRLTRALSTRDLAVYYLSSLVGVGVAGGSRHRAEQSGAGLTAGLVGTAALMGSYERHVWHNRSTEAPLVFLSTCWMPLDKTG